MARPGSERRPAIVRVPSEQRAAEIIPIFEENGWHFILGVEPDEPEDITELERLLHPIEPVRSRKDARNAPFPCGSGRKYKHCCGV